MSTQRDRILNEMGLGPVWRLRGQGSFPVASVEPPVEPPVAPPEGASVDSTIETEFAASAPSNADRESRIARMDWQALKPTVESCTACGLCNTRTNTVFGVGDEAADWLIIGEAPGAEEDARGEPFVGQAGRLLDNMLTAIDLNRHENVYIANVLKCRPPGNRNPESSEVAQCSPYLKRQIAMIRPRIIIAMGRFAAQTLLATDASISSMRGRVHQYEDVPLVVTYHPAYLLRTLPDKAKAWDDLLFARRTLQGVSTQGLKTQGLNPD